MNKMLHERQTYNRYLNLLSGKYITYYIILNTNCIQLTYIPFRIGLNLTLIALKSGRSSGFSAQQSSKQSLTKSKLFSSSSNGGLYQNGMLCFTNLYILMNLIILFK
jgi:hypothetical protein